MRLRYFENEKGCIENARHDLQRHLAKKQSENVSVLLCLSGGSALKILDNFDYGVISSNVTIVVLDERFSDDPSVNNYLQIKQTGFVEKVGKRGGNFIETMHRKDESRDDFAVRFENELLKWRESNPEGEIVATAGMGPDGHTSGIIPNSKEFEKVFLTEEKRLVVGYVAANKFSERVTTTFEFLRLVSFVVLVIMGEEKREAMSRFLSEEGSIRETPARIWREVDNVNIFTNIDTNICN